MVRTEVKYLQLNKLQFITHWDNQEECGEIGWRTSREPQFYGRACLFGCHKDVAGVLSFIPLERFAGKMGLEKLE